MTDGQNSLIVVFLVGWGGQLKSWVHVFASSAFWTQPSQVVAAEHSAHVSMPTLRTVPAETAVIPASSKIDYRNKLTVNARGGPR